MSKLIYTCIGFMLGAVSFMLIEVVLPDVNEWVTEQSSLSDRVSALEASMGKQHVHLQQGADIADPGIYEYHIYAATDTINYQTLEMDRLDIREIYGTTVAPL